MNRSGSSLTTPPLPNAICNFLQLLNFYIFGESCDTYVRTPMNHNFCISHKSRGTYVPTHLCAMTFVFPTPIYHNFLPIFKSHGTYVPTSLYVLLLLYCWHQSTTTFYLFTKVMAIGTYELTTMYVPWLLYCWNLSTTTFYLFSKVMAIGTYVLTSMYVPWLLYCWNLSTTTFYLFSKAMAHMCWHLSMYVPQLLYCWHLCTQLLIYFQKPWHIFANIYVHTTTFVLLTPKYHNFLPIYKTYGTYVPTSMYMPQLLYCWHLCTITFYLFSKAIEHICRHKFCIADTYVQQLFAYFQKS